MGIYDALDDGQPQSGANDIAGRLILNPVKALKDPASLCGTLTAYNGIMFLSELPNAQLLI